MGVILSTLLAMNDICGVIPLTSRINIIFVGAKLDSDLGLAVTTKPEPCRGYIQDDT